jgi:hypothetical protein
LRSAPTALRHCDEALATLAALPRYDGLLEQVGELCIRFAEAGRPRSIDAVLQVRAADIADAHGPLRAFVLIAHSQRDACAGNLERAGEQLQQALDIAIDSRLVWPVVQVGPLLVHNEIRAGRFAQAEAEARRLLGVPGLEQHRTLAGQCLHAQALTLHQRGDADGARTRLGRASDSMPCCRWSMLARLDAVWLDIEAGRLSAARRGLEATFSWPARHPVGQAVRARLQCALGQWHAAVVDQTCAVAGLHPVNSARAAQAALLQTYRDGAAGRPPSPPPAQQLPSML